MIELTTSNAGETAALGAAIAALATGGEMVVLSGEMGAGKTALTKGLAAALGVADPVTSPTFTLVHEYSGRLRLFHLDVYRIDQLDEVADLAIPELLDDDALVDIEWGDSIAPALPQDYLEVRLSLGVGDDDRSVVIDSVGPMWRARLQRLSSLIREGGTAC